MRRAAITFIALIAGSAFVSLPPRIASRPTPTSLSNSRSIALSGTPSAVVLNDGATRAFVGMHSFALGSVAVIDTRAGRLLKEIDIGAPPLALRLARRERRMVVLTAGTDLTRGRGSLRTLDATSGVAGPSALVKVGANALAVDDASRRVLVTSGVGAATTLTLYDASTLMPTAQLTLGTQGRPLAVAAAGGRAIVTTSAGRAYLVDDAKGRVIRAVGVGNGAGLVDIDAQGGRAFVASEVSNTLAIIDLSTGALLRTVDVGLVPSGLGSDPAARRVMVAGAGDGTLTLLDARSGTPLRVVAVGAHPRDVVVDERAALAAIPTDDGVSIVDARTGAVLRRIPINAAAAAAISPSDRGPLAVVASIDDSAVRLIDLHGLSRQAAIVAGPSPDRSLAVVRAFVDAYNAHDVAGVLSTVADDIAYADCNYASAQATAIQGKAALEAWLRARFAEHDRLLQARIEIQGAGVAPPGPGGSLLAIRVNDVLQAQQRLKMVAAKIALTSDGDHLRSVRCL